MHLNPSPMRNFQGRIAYDSSPSLSSARNNFVLPLSMAFQSVDSGCDYDARPLCMIKPSAWLPRA